MDDKKFQFIICSNNDLFLEECLNYISLLEVPDGYSVDALSIAEAKSMASGYNEGMAASDAKYKIYLHQDVFIIYRKFLYALLDIFHSDDTIGMIGMVGSPKLPECGIMWYGAREGQLYGVNVPEKSYTQYEYCLSDGLHEVQAVDGLLIATSRDIPWREDLFDGWDFYDVSQSFEFRRRGLKVVVPEQFNPWCKHDDGFLNYANYNKYRKIFLREYDSMTHPAKENINSYVLVYEENTSAQAVELLEKLRKMLDSEEKAVYYIGLSKEDTYEDCIDQFYEMRPDVIYTVDGAGFSLTKKNGEMLYNSLYCDCVHILTGNVWRFGYQLTKRMNFNTKVVVESEISKKYLERYCENIPEVVWKPEIADYDAKEALETIEKRINSQTKTYKDISWELIRRSKEEQKSYEQLLEAYLTEKKIAVTDEEFVDLLIQMRDVGEYLFNEK